MTSNPKTDGRDMILDDVIVLLSAPGKRRTCGIMRFPDPLFREVIRRLIHRQEYAQETYRWMAQQCRELAVECPSHSAFFRFADQQVAAQLRVALFMRMVAKQVAGRMEGDLVKGRESPLIQQFDKGLPSVDEQLEWYERENERSNKRRSKPR